MIIMADFEKKLDLILGNIAPKSSLKRGFRGDYYLSLSASDFSNAVAALAKDEFLLVDLFCTEGLFGQDMTLVYAFEKKPFDELLIILRSDAGVASIARTFPTACWYEQEISDGFGINFKDSFDERRLFLHDIYPKELHPLRKSFKNRSISMQKSPKDEYLFKSVYGEGVYQIPVGPVHAGIIEPGHFRFSVIGETIFNLEIRMFYKHRGLEKLAEGKTPQECVKVAESISGDETCTNSFAFCNAIELISKIKVPNRASHLRVAYLELERIYSLLSDLAGMIIDIAYPVGASPFFVLREEILRFNEKLTGSRFLKGAVCIGGVNRDVSNTDLSALSKYLDEFSLRFTKAVEHVNSMPSVVDRLDKAGVVKRELIALLNLTGPIARASGESKDTRIDHPYCIYSDFRLKLKVLDAGDVFSRFKVKYWEILESVDLINKIVAKIPGGQIAANYVISDGFTFSLVESARGQNIHFVSVKNGLIDRYKIRTASFCNWKAIEHAVMGNIVPDFPLINKSMNLSYAGTDL